MYSLSVCSRLHLFSVRRVSQRVFSPFSYTTSPEGGVTGQAGREMIYMESTSPLTYAFKSEYSLFIYKRIQSHQLDPTCFERSDGKKGEKNIWMILCRFIIFSLYHLFTHAFNPFSETDPILKGMPRERGEAKLYILIVSKSRLSLFFFNIVFNLFFKGMSPKKNFGEIKYGW